MSDISNHTSVVNDWLNRSYSEATVQSFTKIALNTASRVLRVANMITTYTTSIAETVPLPPNFAELYLIRHENGVPLHYISRDDMFNTTEYESPNSYTIVGLDMITDGRIAGLGTNITISYFARPPELSAIEDTDNWMVAHYYPVLLWGSLLAATVYGLEDDRIPVWQAAYDNAVTAANVEFLKSSVSGSTLRMPARKGFG